MRIAVVALMLGVWTAGGVEAASPVSVTGVWVRATVPGQQEGAGYLTIMSRVGDRLTGVSSPDAVEAMLHRSTSRGGMAGMEDVDGLVLPAGQTLRLEPRGMHVMLMGLKHPLVAGSRIELDLTFEHAGQMSVHAPVLPVGSHGPVG